MATYSERYRVDQPRLVWALRSLRMDVPKGSNPTPNRVRCITRFRVEAELGVWSVGVNDVNQPLEQDEVTGDCPDARADQDTVESLLIELRRENFYRGLAIVGEAKVCVVAQSIEAC